ncbi:hypothetical protein QAD02_024386 [Eretmocerus hayati]|uniref:Uncharacterized protein n=1 Tax=Eretmocerus hayati TaxID=131215 RepID=A0ACC2Q075_9HYME|nr:hypothetical protein QAD02_024386 [Eretmocerus hayati]
MPDEDSDKEELIELVEWVTKESTEFPCLKMRVPGFAPVKNFNASAIEVEVLKNKITRPINAPFKIVKDKPKGRELLYDRKFYPGSALDGALDLVVMAWARVHEPTRWSIRTIQGLFASCLELCYDSVLASEDTSVPRMLDDLLDEFTVANYQFRAVLGPLHAGSLYAKAGWNLAMALEKLFEAKVYTGATIVCGDKHVGVMKRDDKFYAWWPLLKSKKLRIVVSRCMRDYLKLIVKELGQKEPMEFSMRIVTVSYAKLLAPHCSDIDGLHESLLPSSEIAEVLVPESKDYDLESLYRPTDKCRSPLYIRGVAAICDRDAVTEPLVKRCYFVALVALVLRRDIIQNPLPAMVDKVLEVAEATYKLIEKPKYHTDHVIQDLPLMNRIFNVRDRASELTLLLDDDGYVLPKKSLSDELSKKLRRFFDRHTAALLHLSNCSYGLWYSGATECYYLLDPYACDCKGRRTCARGKGCLSIFATLCELVKHISSNRYEHTSGFFLHSVHVEAVNELCAKKDELVKEDPVWLYLDCHWSFWHELKARREGEEDKGNTPSTSEPPRYKNYLIEIPGKVYSLWGTVGAFDSDFGVRAGKAQAAICIAAIAMRNLSQPSDWCPAILDSAVVLGDHYYRDSNKDESNRCLNRFNLTECLRASPHKWKVKFSSEICGVLYSRGEQPNLAECVSKGLSRSKNLVLQCQRRFLAVLRTSDALYVVDPSWVGPPLYAKDHGAVYALRCNDERTLVYVLTKMLNTNESLELSITPIELSFCQESCDPTDSKYKNRILSKTHHSLPGRVAPSSHCQPLVCGDLVAPSEDSYLGYKYKLKLGLASDLEKPPKPKSTKPSLPTKRYSLADKERKLRVEVNKIRRQRTNHPKVVDVADRKAGGVDRAKLKRAVVLPPRRSFVKCETKELYGKYNASLKKPVYMGLLHPGDRDPDDERWPRPGPPGSNLFGQTKKHK